MVQHDTSWWSTTCFFVVFIQEVLTKGSEALFLATGHKAYIDSVTIVTPRGWSSQPTSGITQKSTLSPDIVVNHYEPGSDSYGNAPYAKHYDECGEQGEFVHYTDQYLTNDMVTNNFGDAGKRATIRFPGGGGGWSFSSEDFFLISLAA